MSLTPERSAFPKTKSPGTNFCLDSALVVMLPYYFVPLFLQRLGGAPVRHTQEFVRLLRSFSVSCIFQLVVCFIFLSEYVESPGRLPPVFQEERCEGGAVGLRAVTSSSSSCDAQPLLPPLPEATVETSFSIGDELSDRSSPLLQYGRPEGSRHFSPS